MKPIKIHTLTGRYNVFIEKIIHCKTNAKIIAPVFGRL